MVLEKNQRSRVGLKYSKIAGFSDFPSQKNNFMQQFEDKNTFLDFIMCRFQIISILQ